MKNEYNKKKQIAIITLSTIAVCLAGGLMWYMGTLGNTQPPVTQPNITPETTQSVTVPEIKTDSPSTEPDTSEPETTSPPETTAPAETVPPTQAANGAGTVTGDVQKKPSESKPKTPDEATPPAEPPKDTTSSAPVENPDNSGQCQPEHTPQQEPNQPQGGETRSDGAVYVPGFGWVEDSGEENQTIIAPNAGTGEPVGEM